MKSEIEAILRINELKEKIKILECKKKEELNKLYSNRSYRFLVFLNKELSRFELALHELEWVIEN
jgi:hypothetical protein